MAEISGIYAREILDSRGVPAVEAEVELATGTVGRASVPALPFPRSGETRERRDGDPARYDGRGVLSAVENIRKIIRPELVGMDVFDQIGIDRTLTDADGTPDKSNLGANALCAVSFACAHAACAELKLPLHRYLGGVNAKVLPVPLFTAADGGPAGKFMIRPVGADCFAEALKMASAVLRALEKNADDCSEIPARLVPAVEKAGFVPGKDVTFTVDCAADSLFADGVYRQCSAGEPQETRRSSEQRAAFLAELVEKFPIDILIDPMASADRGGWCALSRAVGKKCHLAGSEFFSSSLDRLKKEIASGTADAIVIHPVQAGTVTGTLDLVETARGNDLAVIIGSCPGETEDCSAADLAVAVSADSFAAGPFAGSGNVCKLNQFLRIEEQLGLLARFGRL
jgi:enolase